MNDYAIPVSCKTTAETSEYVLQFAVMANPEDARIYANNCRKYGAYADVNGVYVSVTYEKDENGKIGPKYS
jgi:hypothetical protein